MSRLAKNKPFSTYLTVAFVVVSIFASYLYMAKNASAAIAIDASSPPVVIGNGGSPGTLTTNTFNPPANALVVVILTADNDTTVTASVADNKGNTYTRYARNNANSGGNEVWGYYYTGAQTGLTVTVTFTGAWNNPNTAQVVTEVLTGASSSQPGTVVTAANSTVSITPQATGSYIFGAVNIVNSGTGYTVNANSTSLSENHSVAGLFSQLIFRSTNLTSNLSAVVYGASATLGNDNVSGVEILASVAACDPTTTLCSQTYSAAGTYNFVPTTDLTAYVSCWGAGGGGDGSASGGGAGGGGGAYASSTLSLTNGATYTFVIGAGGAGGGAGATGSNGGTTTINTTLLVAAPGWGGNINAGAGGLGGAAASSTGSTKTNGGVGGGGDTNGTTQDTGGGGGGAGGKDGDGNPGQKGQATVGGTGGTGDAGSGGIAGTAGNTTDGGPGGGSILGGGGGGGGDNGLAGGIGGTYGGGGGGGENGGAAGADGACVILYKAVGGASPPTATIPNIKIRGGGGGLATITPGTGTNSGVQGGSSVTFAVNVPAGSNTALFVSVGGEAVMGTATYNSISMTNLWNLNSTANAVHSAAYILINPSTGSYNLTVTCTSACGSGYTVWAQPWYGVAQGGTQGTSWRAPAISNTDGGGSATASQSVSNAVSGDMVLDVMTDFSETPTVNASQTVQHFENQLVNGYYWGTSNKSATGATTMQWTMPSTLWAMGAVALIPAGSAATNPSVKVRGGGANIGGGTAVKFR